MVTHPSLVGKAFGVRVRNPAQRELRCWSAIAPLPISGGAGGKFDSRQRALAGRAS